MRDTAVAHISPTSDEPACRPNCSEKAAEGNIFDSSEDSLPRLNLLFTIAPGFSAIDAAASRKMDVRVDQHLYQEVFFVKNAARPNSDSHMRFV